MLAREHRVETGLLWALGLLIASRLCSHKELIKLNKVTLIKIF